MQKNKSSFRDPSGYIFVDDGVVYRYVDQSYLPHFNLLTSSGLLDELFNEELLIKHSIVKLPSFFYFGSSFTIKPEKIEPVTYPYEWCFGQLKEAALLTLEILRRSLNHDMILKDSSAFNVQFKGYKPIFIDTLSFSIYEEGQTWKGYKQFCEHFLSPLLLCSYLGIDFHSLLRIGVDGIPLKITSKLLPLKTWFSLVPFLHIHLHARSIETQGQIFNVRPKVSLLAKSNLLDLVDHLSDYIRKLELKKSDATQWNNYNQETHYSDISKQDKVKVVRRFVDEVDPCIIWDIGSNDGFFSHLITNSKRIVLSLDSDCLAVEKNYLKCKESKNEHIYPLIFDIANPSPSLGWANAEREELSMRSKPDLILALALIHHLVISNNIPFERVAEHFADLSKWLIIEFVPAKDEKIVHLPNNSGKANYTRENFEKGFRMFFDIIAETLLADSQRSIFLLRSRR